jgi:hypothetical protein
LKKKKQKKIKQKRKKTYNNEEKTYLKKNVVCLFFQTLNLHPNKQKFKINKINNLLQEIEKKKEKRNKRGGKKIYFKFCNNLQEARKGISRV